MVIKGEPPTRYLTRSKGVLCVRVLSHGRIVVAKWPPRRRGPLPEVTRRQVTAWDQAQVMVKFVTGEEYEASAQATRGTGFYTRDQLLMAMYGHLVSFPGYGWREADLATIQALLDTICATEGAILYRSASAWVCLPPGAAGQLLTLDSTPLPSWADAPASGIDQLTGDVTAGPGSGSQAATLANSGVTAGSYTLSSITVDAKGRVTAASNGSVATGGPAYQPGLASGRWYTTIGAGNLGTFTVTTGTIYATPFYLGADTTFTQIATGSNSTVGGAQCELAIYADTAGVPGALVYDCGAVATAAAGTHAITGLTLTLSKGWYWLAVSPSTTISASAYTYSGVDAANSLGLLSLQSGNGPLIGISGSWTFSAGHAPNPFPTPANRATTTPVVGLGL